MKSIKKILESFDPLEDKYISREFQSYAILEKALSFAQDSSAKNKGALFMWKLAELRKLGNSKPKTPNSK